MTLRLIFKPIGPHCFHIFTSLTSILLKCPSIKADLIQQFWHGCTSHSFSQFLQSRESPHRVFASNKQLNLFGSQFIVLWRSLNAMKKVEPLCEYCGVLSAVVYCKSDIARLCLNCDEYVHSANFLSSRHNRYLLCDKCNSQPAIFRCMDDKISLCQDCDWENNGCLGLGHNYQILDSYTGCPSSDEFSRIWSSVLDPPYCNDRAEESNQPKTLSLGQKECVAFQSS